MNHFVAGWIGSTILSMCLAGTLFYIVNLIGRHSEALGYTYVGVFEDADGFAAVNFVIKSLSPTVFMLFTTGVLALLHKESLRYGFWLVSILYFLFRVIYIVVMERSFLVNWRRFTIYAATGIGLSFIAYYKLVLPLDPLIPDLHTVGNELWLAIGAFIFTVANQSAPGSTTNKRKNGYIRRNYRSLAGKYGHLIYGKMSSRLLELIAFSIIIYENYNRPPFSRAIERMLPGKGLRSTGIMQVTGERRLSDMESVVTGLQSLREFWKLRKQIERSPETATLVSDAISNYNYDDGYVSQVQEIMEIIACRVDTQYKEVFKSIFSPINRTL